MILVSVKKGSFVYSYDPDNDPEPPHLTPEKRELCIGIHNQWPTDFPEFKTTLLKYQAELLKLSRALLRTFALGLGVEENYFDPIVTAPFVSIILQYYPPRVLAVEDLDSLGAHTDFESMSTYFLSLPPSFFQAGAVMIIRLRLMLK